MKKSYNEKVETIICELVKNQTISNKNRYLIYPYSKQGRMVEELLRELGIKNIWVTDKKIDSENENMVPFEKVYDFVDGDVICLLCSESVVYYHELREQSLKWFEGSKILDLCFWGTTFEILRYKEKDARIGILESCAREIEDRHIEGDVAEAGVYKGGFARWINLLFPSRKLYLFDTFEGFEENDIKTELGKGYSNASQDWSDTSEKQVLSIMPYRNNCVAIRGYFPDSAYLSISNETKFVFVSLDMDLYKPILEGLKFFYPKLSVGGYIFVHDCRNLGYQGARKALHEFCEINQVGYVPLNDEWGTAVITK